MAFSTLTRGVELHRNGAVYRRCPSKSHRVAAAPARVRPCYYASAWCLSPWSDVSRPRPLPHPPAASASSPAYGRHRPASGCLSVPRCQNGTTAHSSSRAAPRGVPELRRQHRHPERVRSLLAIHALTSLQVSKLALVSAVAPRSPAPSLSLFARPSLPSLPPSRHLSLHVFRAAATLSTAVVRDAMVAATAKVAAVAAGNGSAVTARAAGMAKSWVEAVGKATEAEDGVRRRGSRAEAGAEGVVRRAEAALNKSCRTRTVPSRTFYRWESQSRSGTNPSSLAPRAAGRCPKVRRQLYDGTKRRSSDCTLHSPHLRTKEIGTGHCDPQRGRCSRLDTCRYHPSSRPCSPGSRALGHLFRDAEEVARNAPRERPTVPVPECTSLPCLQSNWYSRRDSLGRQRCRRVRQGTYILRPTLPTESPYASCPRSRSVLH